MKYFLTAVTALVTLVSMNCGGAKTPDYTGSASVIPLPVSMEMKDGSFALPQETVIFVKSEDEATQKAGSYLAEKLNEMGISTTFAKSRSDECDILITDTGAAPVLNSEGYIVEIAKTGIYIRATDAAGSFYGIQTLLQLAENKTNMKNSAVVFPCTYIWDEPRYSWRGFMLDCSRTFWPKDVILRYIDLLAMHKMNVFHLHLTDDQGWRVEIKAYPKLTEVGAEFDPRYEGEVSGFYSQEDIREIVAYAEERFVTVVPEIDIPGHMTAALVAYPQLSCTGTTNLWVYPFFQRPEHIAGLSEDILCAGNPEVYRFLDAVMTELIDLFPSKYIHIGGDEAPKARWEKCPKCQAKIKAEGLHDEHELQSYMTGYLADFLENRGRKLIGWDEIIEGGLKKNAAVMYWRGWIADAPMHTLENGNELVMSPTSHCYFDYTYDIISTEHAYGFDPVPEGADSMADGLLLGVQANMWTHIARDLLSLDRQVFPRLAAIAEVGWSPADSRDLAGFKARLVSHYKRLDAMNVAYFVPMPDGYPERINYRTETEIRMVNPVENAVIHYTLDDSEPTIDSEIYSGPFTLKEGGYFLSAKTFLPNGNASETRKSMIQWSLFEPVTISKNKQGLSFKYFEQSFESAWDIRNATETSSGNIDSFSIPSVARPEQFGLDISGYIEIPEDGWYTFSTATDDGSRLFVAGGLSVFNDGFHGAIEKTGKSELLKGIYPIRLLYFQGGGGGSVKVFWEGPGFEKQEIPAEALWRE